MPDFSGMFAIDVPVAELFLRATIVYLLLIFAMRFLARREAGSLELPDLLMVVLIADGVQNGISAEYATVTGAIVVGGTIIGWNYTLTMLMYRFPVLRKMLRPSPLHVIEHGQFVRANLRKEFITPDEVTSMLRSQGIFDVHEVERAYLEADGQISVRKQQSETDVDPASRRRRPAH